MINENFYSVLLLTSSQTLMPHISSLFPQSMFYPVKIVSSVLEARRSELFREFDIIVINSPLVDENGLNYALDMSKKPHSSILFLSPSAIYSDVLSLVRGSGIFVLKKPLSLSSLENSVMWLTSTSDKIRKLEREKVRVEEKMEEIKIINRAKWILINDLEMNEEEAQRFITKEAMDKCISKKEEATIIINTYRPI